MSFAETIMIGATFQHVLPGITMLRHVIDEEGKGIDVDMSSEYFHLYKVVLVKSEAAHAH